MIPRILPFFFGFVMLLAAASASAQLRGYDDSFADSQFAVLTDIDPNTGSSSVPPEYEGCFFPPPKSVVCRPMCASVAAFIGGMAYVGETLYALEWVAATSGSDIYLSTIDVDPTSGCATANRVDPNSPVGFVELESLAYVPGGPTSGTLYSVDWTFDPPHQGRLIEIDLATALGSAVGGPMASDVRIVGLAPDAAANVLVGVSSGFGGASGRPSELLTIDRATGVETLVGITGLVPNAVESLAWEGSGRLLSAGTQLYELDRATGLASPAIGGNYNGTIWAMSTLPSDAGDPCGTSGDTDVDDVCDDVDNCPMTSNTDQVDTDEDDVGDACDNCTAVFNQRVASPPAWMTLTGGQRDDDGDGYGNLCDGKFDTAGTNVGPLDVLEFVASLGKNRETSGCGTSGSDNCARYDLDEAAATNIGPPDILTFIGLLGGLPGPRCAGCPLP